MDCEGGDNPSSSSTPGENASLSAVNSLILDYYKKFGRKRDLEQYFSLSTAQSDIRDPSSAFWTRMKSEQESDSGERSDKKSDSSQELCRISIRCSVPDPCTSQEEDSKTKTESVSPPIIVEEACHDSPQCSEDSRQHSLNSRHHSEDDAEKSDDNHSQKSYDVLDVSANKPLSPTSSAASQRRLEWDSLADVGYDHHSDRKTSASSLSTLERMALHQQYSNETNLGLPTAQSTPLETNEAKPKTKRSAGKKSTKIYKKDVDFLEVNVPHSSANPSQLINVNLTKHISFNVENDGNVIIEDVHRDVSVSPEKVNTEGDIHREKLDKEIQTSLIKTKDSNVSAAPTQNPKIPIVISLNTLRNRTRRKRFRKARRKLKKRMDKGSDPHEKSGQLSEAESFEYMPGHIYNQNQCNERQASGAAAGNQSSLESTRATDSSRGSRPSFSKDLAKSVDFLKNALQNRYDDADLKKKLIKQVCQRLIETHYRDDSTTDFLSGTSDGSKKSADPTTSTSDATNSADSTRRPKKSILRADKFNAGELASSSQSAPNLHVASSDKPVSSHLAPLASNRESDISSREKTSSAAFRTSEALYQKYLKAVEREEAHRRHLKDKEVFLKQKLAGSDGALKIPAKIEAKSDKLKDLLNDLTRNNYNNGSGDASLLEGTGAGRELDGAILSRSQRSHSVFTLSSGSDKKANGKKKLQGEAKDLARPGSSRKHYCCCPHHGGAGHSGMANSAVQVDIKNTCTHDTCPNIQPSPRHARVTDSANVAADAQNKSADIKYVCCCRRQDVGEMIDNIIVYQCPHYKLDELRVPDERVACRNDNGPSTSKNPDNVKSSDARHYLKRVTTKSSQTNMLLKMLRRKSSENSSASTKSSRDGDKCGEDVIPRKDSLIYEATRWIQTEISIDPRISEATLSDVNIVSDSECARLVSEHCRRPSKPSLADIFVSQTDAETCTDSGSVKSGTSKAEGAEFEDRNIPLNENKYQPDKNNGESFAIPIQGTNMMLTVSIGADRNAGTSKEEEIRKEETADTVKVGGKKGKEEEASVACATSKREETNKVLKIDHNSNCVVNSTTVPQSSTYPKTHESKNVACTKQKLSKACSVQTDHCNNRDAETQENIPIETQTSLFEIRDSEPGHSKDEITKTRQSNLEHTSNIENTKDRKNSRDRSDSEQDEEKLNSDLVDLRNKLRKYSKESQCSIESPRLRDRDINILKGEKRKTESQQKEVQSDKKDKASENYEKHDIQDSVFPEQFRKTSSAKKDSLEKINDKCLPTKGTVESCPCGCGGTTDKCLKGCTQRCVLQGERSRSLPIGKNPCTHAVFLSEFAKKCPCGCDGTKDKCSIRCAEKAVTDQLCPGAQQTHANGNKTSTDTEGSNGYKNDNKILPPENIQDSRDSREVATQKGLSDGEKMSQDESDRSRSSREKAKHVSKTITRSQWPQLNSRGEQTDTVSNKDRPSRSEMEPTDSDSDPIISLIRDITRRYSKRDAEKSKRKKCFTDIVLALNYLLETDDRGPLESQRTVLPKASETNQEEAANYIQAATQTDRATQPLKRSKPRTPVKEAPPTSTDVPTSSDSACKVLNKIKKECEKYHQKRCKSHCGRKMESSTTSVSCERCRRVHHCSCRVHRCKEHKKPTDNARKTPIAYNLILQTSESIISEEPPPNNPQLRSIVVKVPRKKPTENIPFKELAAKFERKMRSFSTESVKVGRSRSLPDDSEMSGLEEAMRRTQGCTLREYLEMNRPDFIERASHRQHCVRHCDTRNARVPLPARHHKSPTFISEHEMKRRSETIYKSLPEVTRKKQEARKDALKKTNLLMAQMFRKNLQKKALRGSVNLSHYATVLNM